MMQKRLINLDFLRVFAASSVALFHYTVQYPKFSGQDNPFGFDWFSGTINLFFMISGFVIILSCSKHDPITFLKRRLRTLYPPFLICCTITALILALSPMIKSDVSLVTYLSNISLLALYTDIPFIDGAYWTLSYEIGFYIFMAVAYRYLFAKSQFLLPIYLFTGSLLFALFSTYIPSPLHYFLMIHSYGHLFGYGIAIYLWYQSGFKWYYIPYGFITVFMHYINHNMQFFDVILISSFVILFPIIIFYQLSWNKLTAFICSLGGYTYIFYLLHQMIGFSLIHRLEQFNMPPALILTSVFSLIALLSLSIKKLSNHIQKF